MSTATEARAATGGEEFYDPELKTTYPLIDATKEFSAKCQANAVREETKAAIAHFKAAKRAKAERALALANAAPADPEFHYSLGFWYRDDRLKFTDSTAIRQVIVFPDKVAGGSTYFLYLTATNRSERGVESHIAYYSQESPEFYIFDWSQKNQQGDLGKLSCRFTLADLRKFVFPQHVQGFILNAIHLVNETRFVGGDNWNNRVHLAVYTNGMPDHFETVYSATYPLADKKLQQPQSNGNWGPEVETMRTFCERVNPMGFLGNWLIQDEKPCRLDLSNTYFKDDRNGLVLMYETPTRDFLVH